ncbi:class I SAM-dependent methyltransferase [Pseudonocardia sp. TRM90224]|uniref:class I SAM-dependent methyltransferase n=1 Tax=Pseudonocardia sp. TRM90224 TaxID=2812678 RepID=UPI001E3EEFD3|nr:methyltransferase domain-containing protein [Pseudonocardia sp. TRM90224]
MTAAAVPQRVRWAVDLLDPGPDERILEAGSGPGAAAMLVCERLTGRGSMLAIDRSATATQRISQRCASHVEAGRLQVRTGELNTLDVPDGSLDAAFTINVNLFWTRSPAPELRLLHAALRDGGRLHVCYGSDGPQAPRRITDAITAAMAEHEFTDVAVRSGEGGLAITGRR